MTEKLKVKIMLLVGSNGKVSACTENSAGWGDLADNIMNRNGIDPDATSRYIITVEVDRPSINEITPVEVLEVK
jgi:hypothetical protein